MIYDVYQSHFDCFDIDHARICVIVIHQIIVGIINIIFCIHCFFGIDGVKARNVVVLSILNGLFAVFGVIGIVFDVIFDSVAFVGDLSYDPSSS